MAIGSFTVIGGVVILGLVVLSAFFSSSESAIFTLSDEWLAEQESGDHRLDTLRDLRSDPHRLLVTILVGNNVVNVAIASISTGLLIEYFPAGHAISVATVLASFVVLIFGEIVPKSYGLGHAKQWALRVAVPITIAERVLSPLVTVFDFITRRLNAIIGGESEIEKSYLEE